MTWPSWAGRGDRVPRPVRAEDCAGRPRPDQHDSPTTQRPWGYWVCVYPANSDSERLTAYDKLARPAVQAGAGAPCPVAVESSPTKVANEAGITQRVVMIEFDSFEQAVAAYENEACQKALVALSDGVERDFRIVEGID
jgi:uncharacterized protein (DUF1330 family)